MDIKDISPRDLQRRVIGFFAPMHGGKTEALVQELRRSWYYGFSFIAYNHERNKRERNAIVVNRTDKYAARTVGNIEQVQEDLEHRWSALEIATREGKEEVRIDGIKHDVGRPLKAVGIDEVNLFCLSIKEARAMKDFFDWSREKELVLYIAGLLNDFRQRDFGYLPNLRIYIDIEQSKKPACMAITKEGEKCKNPAKHTQRLWSLPFLKRQELDSLEEGLGRFDYVNKERKDVLGRYVAAPFFDRTVYIEGDTEIKIEKGDIEYLPVCDTCSQLPYMKETLAFYNALIENPLHSTETESSRIIKPEIVPPIMDFLLRENWVRNNNGVLHAIPFYHNELV